MSLTQDLKDLESNVSSMQRKVKWQQMLCFKLINGMVKLHQKHRIAKNYAVSDELREILLSVGVKIKQGTAGYAYDQIPESLKGRTGDDQWTIEYNPKQG